MSNLTYQHSGAKGQIPGFPDGARRRRRQQRWLAHVRLARYKRPVPLDLRN